MVSVAPVYLIELTVRLLSLDYLFQLAVEMKRLDLPWITDIEPVKPIQST